MKKLLTALGTSVLAAATVGALMTAPAGASAPTVFLRPAQVERGPDIAGAHLADLTSTTIVDGDLRLPVRGRYVQLLGKAGNAYVVLVQRAQRWSTLRIGPEAGERVLARGTTPDEVVLASDGRLVAITRSQTRARTVIEVVRVRTGRVVAGETFASSPRVLDLLGHYAVVGGPGAGSIGWDLRTDVTEALSGRAGYAADIGADRLATFTGDPFTEGCSVVTTLTRPQRRLWTSCRERVEAFSPDGRRVATVHQLSDGIGPGQVWERTVRGRLLATYRTGSHFGALRFESDRALLLDTYGRSKAATIRCTAGSCRRASVLVDTPEI